MMLRRLVCWFLGHDLSFDWSGLRNTKGQLKASYGPLATRCRFCGAVSPGFGQVAP